MRQRRFMDNLENARQLAHSIVKVANGAGTRTSALITDMNQVLRTHRWKCFGNG